MGPWSIVGGPTIHLLYINPYPAQNVGGPGPTEPLRVTTSLLCNLRKNASLRIYSLVMAPLVLKTIRRQWERSCNIIPWTFYQKRLFDRELRSRGLRNRKGCDGDGDSDGDGDGSTVR